jgi:hypothetical protein
MKLGGHRPGSLTSFVDGASGETLLQIAADSNGDPKVAFKLFDCDGNLVQETEGFQTFPEGLSLQSTAEELLLKLPADPLGDICYKIYAPDGRLLAASDGSRTQIFGGLRLDGAKAPSRTKSASS